jgi:hypothetical protein
MRQLTLASQGGFEKYGKGHGGSSFWQRWMSSCRGRSRSR